MHGFAGQILWVDLTKGTIRTEAITMAMARMYLGGRGFGVKLLWDLARDGVDPLGPENPLIIMTGTLGGTFAPNSGRMSIVCKSPATGLYLKTNVGAHMAPELKYAGYDGIVFTGQSEEPVYLWIDDDHVELRRAAHLWGKDTRTTDRLIKEEVGDDQIKILQIGPAGENRVKFASIMSSIYRAAGRGGAGAVMGSKKLKAIAVRGTGDVTIANPDIFQTVALAARRALRDDEYCWTRSFKFGTAQGLLGANEAGILPRRNFQDGYTPDGYKLSGEYVSDKYARPEGCSACVLHCGRFSVIKGGSYQGTHTAGPEYETLASLGSKCDITDVPAVIKGNELCNILGMDTISAGSMVAFAMECFEKGILTEADTSGLNLSWGNGNGMLKLLEMMAYRKDIGDLLAEGTKIASEHLGQGSEKFDMQVKGLEQSLVDVRGSMSYALAFAVNPRGPDHLMTEVLAEFAPTPEARELAVSVAETEEAVNSFSVEGKPKLVVWHEKIYCVSDCLGICVFTTTWSYTRVNFENMACMFEAATGIPLSVEEIRTAAERIITLERCFNYRQGATSKDDTLPQRMFEPSPTLKGGAITLTRESLKKMVNSYYAEHHWDRKTGFPTDEALERLDLMFVKEV